jgi:hypothetical protein
LIVLLELGIEQLALLMILLVIELKQLGLEKSRLVLKQLLELKLQQMSLELELMQLIFELNLLMVLHLKHLE